jgi:hypothetical protein
VNFSQQEVEEVTFSQQEVQEVTFSQQEVQDVTFSQREVQEVERHKKIHARLTGGVKAPNLTSCLTKEGLQRRHLDVSHGCHGNRASCGALSVCVCVCVCTGDNHFT